MYVFVTDTGSRVNVITRRSFSSPIDCDDDKANDYDGAQMSTAAAAGFLCGGTLVVFVRPLMLLHSAS